MINLEQDEFHSTRLINSLRNEIFLLERINKRQMACYNSQYKFGLTRIIEKIQKLKPEFVEKGFPVGALEDAVRHLREALSRLDTHQIHWYREDVENVLESWNAPEKRTKPPLKRWS